MEIEATYQFSTPLFCRGADPQPEFRLPSFKGVLRYWWRALAWSRYQENLQAIKGKEDALFGAPAAGKSRVSMRLLSESSAQQRNPGEDEVLTVSSTNSGVIGEGARYLGYCVMEAFGSKSKGTKAGQLKRACLREPLEVKVQLHVHGLGRSDPDDLTLLTDALIALGTIGGMGAKSRKGYGSLVLKSLCIDDKEQWDAPQSTDDLDAAISSTLSKYHNKSTLPEFTAFSSGARYVLLSSKKREPLELLDLVGRELIRYRSWGRDGRVFGKESEKNFKDDHDLMKQPPNQPKMTHPRRIAFGLPHNYGKGKERKVVPWDPSLDRRASPLFIHIHQFDRNNPVAVLSFLPARFLPKSNDTHPDISVGGHRVRQESEEKLYDCIHKFLNRCRSLDSLVEGFTEAKEVEVPS